MTTDQHLNTGSMALDALPEDEAAAFTEHLETCPTCSAELASFLETAAILGGSVAQAPPASLRRSVMQAVATTAQLPPLTSPVGAADPVMGRHRQAPDAAEPGGSSPDMQSPGVQSVGSQWPGVQSPNPRSPGAEVPGVQSPAEASSPPVDLSSEAASSPDGPLATVTVLRRPWYRRPQALLAAAVAAVVLGGGVTAVVATRSPATQTATQCVAAATDKSVLTPTAGAKGDVTLSPTCDAAVINMPFLPPAPAGKVYQVWVIKGKNASSVKVLGSNAGNASSQFSTPVHAGDSAIGVTIEPSPGSPKPTVDPFWLVPLTS